jgi:prevent-host-death family protein
MEVAMKMAAISELKASLSEYLAGLKAGEKVIVTDRGNPVAKLVQVNRQNGEISGSVLILEKAGLARIGTGLISRDFWKRPRFSDKQGRALKYLLQERGEGRCNFGIPRHCFRSCWKRRIRRPSGRLPEKMDILSYSGAHRWNAGLFLPVSSVKLF